MIVQTFNNSGQGRISEMDAVVSSWQPLNNLRPVFMVMPDRKRYITDKLKECSWCLEIKPLSEFYKRTGKNKHLLQSRCKVCVREENRLSMLKHHDRKKRKDKEYHLANRKKRLKYLKKYQEENINKRNEYNKRKYYSDPNFRLQNSLRSRVRRALKNNSKGKAIPKLIGCSIPELKLHIEKQFREGMGWDNYSEWHIDHIVPCSEFDLANPEDQLICFHYSNMQPLWEDENRKKGRQLNIDKEVYYR